MTYCALVEDLWGLTLHLWEKLVGKFMVVEEQWWQGNEGRVVFFWTDTKDECQ